MFDTAGWIGDSLLDKFSSISNDASKTNLLNLETPKLEPNQRMPKPVMNAGWVTTKFKELVVIPLVRRRDKQLDVSPPTPSTITHTSNQS